MNDAEFKQQMRQHRRGISALELQAEARRRQTLRLLDVERAGTWGGWFPLKRDELLQDLHEVDQEQARLLAWLDANPLEDDQ